MPPASIIHRKSALKSEFATCCVRDASDDPWTHLRLSLFAAIGEFVSMGTLMSDHEALFVWMPLWSVSK